MGGEGRDGSEDTDHREPPEDAADGGADSDAWRKEVHDEGHSEDTPELFTCLDVSKT